MVKVTGRVTYRGGACPGPGTLYFAPQSVADGSGLRPATAEFAEDGRFSVRSFRDNDGLKPGRYRVRMECWQERPRGYDQPGVQVVPPNFQPEDLVVESGRGAMEVSYNIP